MIKITGVAIETIPSLSDLEKGIGKDWMEAWRAAHPRMKQEQTARKSLAGLFLLRLMGGEGELIYEKGGRPYLANAALDFSISHTDSAVFCALSILREEGALRIGLDAEEGGRLLDARLPDLAGRWFSHKEQEIFRANPTRETFLRIWTRKEALVKREGRGLSALGAADTVEAEKTLGVAFHSYRVGELLVTLCADADLAAPDGVEMLSLEKEEGKP